MKIKTKVIVSYEGKKEVYHLRALSETDALYNKIQELIESRTEFEIEYKY